MGHRTQYTPGTFSWVDLSARDADAAKGFYHDLFGWQAEDLPIPDGGYYSMQRLDGGTVAAIAPQPPPMREAGAPPVWQSYITVQSADESATRAGELGANVVMPAFDVMEAGRMAVIQDPQSAFFQVWEPRGTIGAALVNAPGALTWNELASPDVDASLDFYGTLFGWEFEETEGGGMPMRYVAIKNAGANNGGIREKQPQEPPYWLVYFGTTDAAASTAKIGELGGNTIAGPYDIGMGKIAIVQDAQGAVFALFEGQFEE
jgi:uncharacterized protein